MQKKSRVKDRQENAYEHHISVTTRLPLPLTTLLEATDLDFFQPARSGDVFPKWYGHENKVRIVSIVGAGGKTSLLFALARLLLQKNVKVICTTTTKIFPPTPQEGGVVKIMGTLSAEAFSADVSFALRRTSLLTMVGSKIPETGKLGGVPITLFPVLCQTLSLFPQNIWILVEADGARRRPLKAPAIHEPVLPLETKWCIAVFGLDSLGKKIDEKFVHRWSRACELGKQQPGSFITPETLIRLALHPQSFFRACAPECRKVVFYNKVDIAEDTFSVVLPRVRALRNMAGIDFRNIYWFAGSVREGWCSRLF